MVELLLVVVFDWAGSQVQEEESSQDPKGKKTSTLNAVSLEENVRELESLANFYHTHGFPKEAREIRQAILNMRLQSTQRNSTKSVHKIEEQSEQESEQETRASSDDI
jgi:hypothetical protein